jgi:hypothetical protein
MQVLFVEPKHQTVTAKILVRNQNNSDLGSFTRHRDGFPLHVLGLFRIQDLAQEIERSMRERIHYSCVGPIRFAIEHQRG